jgi:hypothetical protein
MYRKSIDDDNKYHKANGSGSNKWHLLKNFLSLIGTSSITPTSTKTLLFSYMINV